MKQDARELYNSIKNTVDGYLGGWFGTGSSSQTSKSSGGGNNNSSRAVPSL